MNGIPQEWLQSVYSAYSPQPATASTTPVGPSASPTFGLPTTAPPVRLPPEMDQPAQPIGPPPPSPAPAPPQPEAKTNPTPPAPEVPPDGVRNGGNEYPLLTIPGGGIIPAHEVERRGPTLLAAQGARNEVAGQTIADAQGRNEDAAALEYNAALQQERMAHARDAAQQQALAEQQEEMSQRQADFDSTVRQLSKMGQIDRGRFMASRSTLGKIAGFVEMALAGFNRAPSLVQKAIDDDVKAQEFAYYATRDTAQAKQTAFSAAMQKYQNADAARAAARAASLDVVQGMFAQVQAKWRGTEAANRAGVAFAALQDEKVNQIANGIQFVLPQSIGRRFYDPRTGLTYSEAEAKAMSAKVDERDFENRKQTAGIGGQLMVEQAKGETDIRKAQLATQRDQSGRVVRLPNGDTVQAPTDKEAEKLRDLSAAVWDAQQLVNEAIQIRSDPTWVASPTKRGRLEQIQSNLVTAFKDSKGLGALSGPDMDLARGGTANLLSGMPGTDAKLQSFADSTTKAVQNRVRGIVGAPDTAQGKLPADVAADFKLYRDSK